MSLAVFSIVFCFSLGFKFSEALTLPNFYPFGANEGDKVVHKNDDGSSGPVQISIAFPFFDENHRSLYVSITTFSTLNYLCLLSKTETRSLMYTFYTVICLSNQPPFFPALLTDGKSQSNSRKFGHGSKEI